MLKTEINTPNIEAQVLRAARFKLRKRNLQADFEHGQWWITHVPSGDQWSVCDELSQYGFCFEQVAEGEE